MLSTSLGTNPTWTAWASSTHKECVTSAPRRSANKGRAPSRSAARRLCRGEGRRNGICTTREEDTDLIEAHVDESAATEAVGEEADNKGEEEEEEAWKAGEEQGKKKKKKNRVA